MKLRDKIKNYIQTLGKGFRRKSKLDQLLTIKEIEKLINFNEKKIKSISKELKRREKYFLFAGGKI
ncbi:MAG: hypothetical protein V1860_02080 [bacterium]